MYVTIDTSALIAVIGNEESKGKQGKKLFYLFDYGDHWLIKVSKSRRKPQQSQKAIKYPRVIERIGENPEQYPMWEE